LWNPADDRSNSPLVRVSRLVYLPPMPRLLLLSLLTLAAADSPKALSQRLQSWLAPPRSSTRQLELTIRSGGVTTHWTAAQARRARDGGSEVLTVLLAPPAVRGTALLVRAPAGKPAQAWRVAVPLGRVRAAQPDEAFAAFADTELAFADLGLVPPRDAAPKVLGADTLDGVAVVKLQDDAAARGRVARIVTWLVPATGQPLKRELFDAADRPWTVVLFGDVAPIHGVPTAQRVRVEDLQTGFGTEYRATRIAYDVALPDDLFDPAKLPQAADAAVWK